jgi:hypothetical protein
VIRAAVLVVLLLPAIAPAQSTAQPTLGPAGLSLPASVLQDARVRKQLGSGLTATFLVTASAGAKRGAGRVEIRYDLWDEVYVVRRLDIDGKRGAQRIPSLEQLEKWWRAPLRVIDAPAGARAEIELRVLPFSAAEEEDARRWLSKSGGVGAGSGPGGLVDVLIGTTLNAKPITTFRWTVEMSRR